MLNFPCVSTVMLTYQNYDTPRLFVCSAQIQEFRFATLLPIT